MFDSSPKLYELIFYPTFGGLVAWGIAYNYPSPMTDLFAAAMYINCAFVASFYLYRESCKYADAMTPGQASKPVNLLKDEQPTRADYDNIPAVNTGLKSIYSQNTPRLKIDCFARMNKTFIDQRNGNLEVNMTESFWVKKSGADESRWVRIGGKGPTDWKDYMERGVRFGAYKEIGGQNKRVPADWQKIRRLASGEPLPQ